jgi:hypothetical protein
MAVRDMAYFELLFSICLEELSITIKVLRIASLDPLNTGQEL